MEKMGITQEQLEEMARRIMEQLGDDGQGRADDDPDNPQIPPIV
jgi:hypothetical protein